MRFRLARPTDLRQCQRLIHPAFKCSPQVWEAMPRIWEAHMGDHSMAPGVIEDVYLPESEQLLFFAISAFVEDRFLEDFLATPGRPLVADIYERILAGCSPVLARNAIARANATGGLNLVVLHHAMRDFDLSK